MGYKYQNCNPYPVFVPGKRGIQVQFRPNEWSTDEWYSRFVSPGRLSKIQYEGGKVVPQPARNQKEKPFPAIQKKFDIKSLVTEEETTEYIKRSGIYFCKLCDLFRTGSKKAFTVHLDEYHKMKPEDNVYPVTGFTKEEEPVVVRSSISSPKIDEIIAQGDKEQVLVSSDTVSPPKPEPPVLQSQAVSGGSGEGDVVTCEICQKQFKSEKGLAIHKSRNH